MIFQKIFAILLLAYSLSLVACAEQAISTSISAQQLQSRIENHSAPIIVDVRSQEEFDKGHIPGAIHMPLKGIKQSLSQLADNKSSDVVVYCHSGPRALSAAEILYQAGFSRVIELDGHYAAWKDAKLPVSTGVAKRP